MKTFAQLRNEVNNPFQRLLYEILSRFHTSDYDRALSAMSDDLRQIIEDCSLYNDTRGWVAVTESLPKPFQTVWLANGFGLVCLGCRVEHDGGWHWARSNGIIHVENDEIVSECESEDDLDVIFWHELPTPPCR